MSQHARPLPAANRSALSWFRFSLRFLLLAVTIGCVAGGWWINRVHQQGAAVRRFRELAAMDEYRPSGEPVRFATGGAFSSDNATVPRHFRWLRGFVGDDALGEVVSVNLSDTPATDEDLMHLFVFSSLERLVLNDTKITDDGLRYVSQCRALRELSLWDTVVTDHGLRHLSRLRELESLSLVGTQVSDAGLSEVARMPKLKRLMLNHTAVTDEGYLRLRAALPECEIYASVPAAVAHFKKRLAESRKTQ